LGRHPERSLPQLHRGRWSRRTPKKLARPQPPEPFSHKLPPLALALRRERGASAPRIRTSKKEGL
jgi:hypothetical protein